jgi:hypothetical protein
VLTGEELGLKKKTVGIGTFRSGKCMDTLERESLKLAVQPTS